MSNEPPETITVQLIPGHGEPWPDMSKLYPLARQQYWEMTRERKGLYVHMTVSERDDGSIFHGAAPPMPPLGYELTMAILQRLPQFRFLGESPVTPEARQDLAVRVLRLLQTVMLCQLMPGEGAVPVLLHRVAVLMPEAEAIFIDWQLDKTELRQNPKTPMVLVVRPLPTESGDVTVH